MLRALCIAALVGVSPAQEIAEARWGFDGYVLPGRFNPLTVVVDNPSREPVERALVLEKRIDGMRRGARIVEPCYVSPGTRRAITFYPFVVQLDEEWILRWSGTRVSRFEVPEFLVSARRAVLLDSTELARTELFGLRSFPVDDFPPIVGAADVLSDIVLDHAPQWDAPRREAFLAWLHGGGRLHLLSWGGAVPKFEGELAILNRDEEEFRVSAGTVIRYEHSRAELRRDDLELGARSDGEELWQSIAPSILTQLMRQAQPDHDWALIFLLAIVFLILVGPVHFVWSRRGVDYRVSLAALAGLVALFTWSFLMLGARGIDERTTIASISYAKPIGDGRWDVTQYANLFVTDGDVYRVSGNGARGLFSTSQLYEAVPGRIDNGRDASLVVDIPLFTSRSFVHRAALDGPEFSVEPTGSVSFEIRGEVPKDIVSAWRLRGGHVVPSSTREGELLFQLQGEHISNFLELAQRRVEWQYAGLPGYHSSARKVSSMAEPVLAEQLNLGSEAEERLIVNRPGTVIWILAKCPDAFRLHGAPGAERDAYVLYHLELE